MPPILRTNKEQQSKIKFYRNSEINHHHRPWHHNHHQVVIIVQGSPASPSHMLLQPPTPTQLYNDHAGLQNVYVRWHCT